MGTVTTRAKLTAIFALDKLQDNDHSSIHVIRLGRETSYLQCLSIPSSGECLVHSTGSIIVLTSDSELIVFSVITRYKQLQVQDNGKRCRTIVCCLQVAKAIKLSLKPEKMLLLYSTTEILLCSKNYVSIFDYDRGCFKVSARLVEPILAIASHNEDTRTFYMVLKSSPHKIRIVKMTHASLEELKDPVTLTEEVTNLMSGLQGILYVVTKKDQILVHTKLDFAANLWKAVKKSYLTDRTQYVNVLGETSEKLHVLFGVPQGSCLGPLLFLIYINDLPNISIDTNFVLFADDTNIFVKAVNKMLAYEKANKVLEQLNLYMVVNKLHINMSKCCFIDFKSPKSDNENENYALKIKTTKIKQVNEAKFLGVTIDENLNWNSHIKKLSKKLSCSAGILNLIKDNIPEELHKNLYYTLFESHLSYGITVWGGVSNNKIEPLFKKQKKCLRILFGDKEAYLNKFKSCARAKGIENQYLGQEFYRRENSKPLFNGNNIMNVRNLFIYHCSNEIFKILKFRTPICMFEIFTLSNRNGRETRLLTPYPSKSLFYVGSLIWNVVRDLIKIYEFSIKSGPIKSAIRGLILKIQKQGDPDEWQHGTWNTLQYQQY